MEIKVYKDKQEVAREFSEYLASRIKSNKNYTVALSGGSTPKIVFDYLAVHFKDLNWSNVHFYWGDERCVPPTHEESNYKMTVDHLLSKISIPEENIHRVLGENEPKAEASRYDDLLVKNLKEADGIPQFDLVILGMGGDGHTASIFPHEIELWDSSRNCEVAIHPDSGQRRVSLTGRVINNAKEVAFLVTGADKKEKVTSILAQDAASKDYPASLVQPKSGNLIWFLDEAAKGE
ncbi:6-phosphogluconolactonase [Fulvivirga lutimaris]|uniref:6-phosphogluconolactonase n=1 Tax=Fulvivirga lutimaris TaxID=1819566 RepID=UPI0012BC4013|nr:6-phosphogluconolactonase [Fulvivirga lutimaris]MTI39929.1 6-phosphogluconolactonase [Fulvivirga lutimaris]